MAKFLFLTRKAFEKFSTPKISITKNLKLQRSGEDSSENPRGTVNHKCFFFWCFFMLLLMTSSHSANPNLLKLLPNLVTKFLFQNQTEFYSKLQDLSHFLGVSGGAPKVTCLPVPRSFQVHCKKRERFSSCKAFDTGDKSPFSSP